MTHPLVMKILSSSCFPRSWGREGVFHLVEELKLYHSQFQTYFRMSVGQFVVLLQILALHLRRQSSNQWEAIDPKQHLVVCLRWASCCCERWGRDVCSTVPHNHCDWLKCLLKVWKKWSLFHYVKVLQRDICILCEYQQFKKYFCCANYSLKKTCIFFNHLLDLVALNPTMCQTSLSSVPTLTRYTKAVDYSNTAPIRAINIL